MEVAVAAAAVTGSSLEDRLNPLKIIVKFKPWTTEPPETPPLLTIRAAAAAISDPLPLTTTQLPLPNFYFRRTVTIITRCTTTTAVTLITTTPFTG